MADESLSLMDRASTLAKSNAIVPVTQDFDESKGVASRTNAITKSDSPLMQTAATKAAQASNARGLNSSTLGVQAGQQAVIETATPIATADANLSQQQALANQTAKNSAATANSTNTITAGVQGMSLDNSNTQQNKSLMESARQFDTGQATTKEQFAVTSGQNATQIANQASQAAATLALQSKQVDAQIEQFAQNLGLTTQELQLKKDSLASSDRQALQTLELQKSQLAQQQAQFETSQATSATQFDAKLKQDAAQFGLTQAQQKGLAELDAATKVKMAEIDAATKASTSSDSNISNAWGTMMQQVGSIQNNTGLDNAAKTTLVQNTIDSFQNFAKYYGKVANIDVSTLLNFGTGSNGGGSTGGTGSTPGNATPAPAPANSAPSIQVPGRPPLNRPEIEK